MMGPSSNVEIGFHVSKYDIRPQFECQNKIPMPKSIFGPSSNIKIGFRMSKCDIWPQFECQIRISNIKIGHSARIRMSIKDFECQNSIFGPNLKVKIGYQMLNSIFGPNSNVKIGFRM